MNAYARWFRILGIIGIILNVIISIAAIVAPEWLLSLLNLEPATPLVWARFSGNLLILLSLFYIPGAIDPYHYRATAVLSVLARFTGLLFFLTQPREYLIFGFYDLSFGIPEGILLWLAFQEESSSEVRT